MHLDGGVLDYPKNRNMKHKKVMLIAILLVLAILATNVFAGITDSKIFKAINNQSRNWESWTVIAGLIAALTIFITRWGIPLILSNPAVAGPEANPAIVNTVNSFLYLLVPFYIIALVVTGIYFLFSQSSSGRAKSKSMFFKLIISMGAVLIALPLFQLFLDISGGIAQLIFNIGGDYVNIEGVLGGTTLLSSVISLAFNVLPSGKLIAFILMLFGALTLAVIILILVMRYLIVVLAAIIFPFTLVLWLFDFPYTRHIGAKLMNHTIVWIFVPVITATIVVFLSVIAGGFYEQCGIPWLTDTDCWLCYFAGLAATFLILAAPLMMYGIMPWVGAAILFFGWTIMAAPATPQQGLGPWGAGFYGLPGSDLIARIPGVEKALDRALGIRPIYGVDGRILGWKPIIDGFASGEIPMSAPLTARPAIKFFGKLRKPSDMMTMPLYGPLAEGRTLGTLKSIKNKLLYKPATEDIRGIYRHYGRGIEKVLDARDITTGTTMSDKTAMATMPLRGPLAEGRTPLAWKTSEVDLTYKPFTREYETWYNPFHPKTAIPKLGPLGIVAAGGILAGMGPAGIITAGLKGLWIETGAKFPMEAKVPVVEGGVMGTRTTLAPEWYARQYSPEIILEKSATAFRKYYPEEYKNLLDWGKVPEGQRPQNVKSALHKLESAKLAPEAEVGYAHAPPPHAEAAAEEKRREKEREFIEQMRRMEGEYRLSKESVKGSPELGERVKDRYKDELLKSMRMRIKGEEKIRKELTEARTYKEYPVERARREIQAPMEQIEFVLDNMWPAFGQTARILSRETYLMHGLANLKTYTPTPPKMPDWYRRQWEAEQARKG